MIKYAALHSISQFTSIKWGWFVYVSEKKNVVWWSSKASETMLAWINGSTDSQDHILTLGSELTVKSRCGVVLWPPVKYPSKMVHKLYFLFSFKCLSKQSNIQTLYLLIILLTKHLDKLSLFLTDDLLWWFRCGILIWLCASKS